MEGSLPRPEQHERGENLTLRWGVTVGWVGELFIDP